MLQEVRWQARLRCVWDGVVVKWSHEKRISEDLKMSKKSQLVSGMGLATQMVAEIVRLAEEIGVSEERLHVLGTSEGVPYLRTLVTALAENPVVIQTEYLRQLFVSEAISVGATDGTRTIAKAKDVFVAGIDSDFVNWELDVPSQPTKATKAIVCEMTRDGTFAEIFGSLKRSLESLCWKQSQIVDFVKKHGDKLRGDGYATFFLFKVDNKFFVARVRVSSDGGLRVYVDRFSDDGVWSASYHLRFAVPQLIA